MYAIEVQATFRATHALRLTGGTLEPAHEHEFRLMARITAQRLDTLDTVLDFHCVEALLESIVGPWRGQLLNGIEPFVARVNPSAERMAEEIGWRLSAALGGVEGENVRGLRVVELRLTEAPGCVGIWSPD